MNPRKIKDIWGREGLLVGHKLEGKNGHWYTVIYGDGTRRDVRRQSFVYIKMSFSFRRGGITK